ncbi:MAG: tRNA uridine-5-carboxymethylaminomethyl(34) synthesis GTPase MnmE [Burkholderiales bacterium]|nr:tRNA uridine-5-carboxymethylaminomethyl(34) synthesis GTPase MnmE [Burkholderiales bacterium]
MNNETFSAISTASGYSGIGIVRINGKDALTIAKQITKNSNFSPKTATLCDFYDSNNCIIDSGLVLYFPGPKSFTGDDIIELQGHGSPVALQMLLNRTLELGSRLAQAGEFSRLAFLNGKVDLIQAESIIDLIHAESESSAKSAMRSLKGSFSKQITTINQQLINLRMFVEASLDFPEEDIDFINNARIYEQLQTIVTEINALLANTKQGVLLNNGADIVIIGRPNVGKSSLLNTLANEDIAIVTDIAGTTRDIIKEKIIINGIHFNIIDTAGIRDTKDKVELIGIQKAINAMKTASICLILIDETIGITALDLAILNNVSSNIPRIFVHNKIDLIEAFKPQLFAAEYANIEHVFISAKNKIGINKLREAILRLIGYDFNKTDVFIARTRHLIAVNQVVEHINQAFNNWYNLEILAEELRYAHNKLSEITGTFSADDLLGEIFSSFCIGK